MRNEICTCDVKGCKKEVTLFRSQDVQVIFITEQTEGTSVAPYFSRETVDLCNDHMGKMLGGTYLWGHGAQGNNTYYFKEALIIGGVSVDVLGEKLEEGRTMMRGGRADKCVVPVGIIHLADGGGAEVALHIKRIKSMGPPTLKKGATLGTD